MSSVLVFNGSVYRVKGHELAGALRQQNGDKSQLESLIHAGIQAGTVQEVRANG